MSNHDDHELLSNLDYTRKLIINTFKELYDIIKYYNIIENKCNSQLKSGSTADDAIEINDDSDSENNDNDIILLYECMQEVPLYVKKIMNNTKLKCNIKYIEQMIEGKYEIPEGEDFINPTNNIIESYEFLKNLEKKSFDEFMIEGLPKAPNMNVYDDVLRAFYVDYDNDDDDDDDSSATDDMNDSKDYAPHAHKHIPLFLNLDIDHINNMDDNNNQIYNKINNSNNTSLFNIQVISNGNDLTLFKIQNGDISLHNPIIVKDTPQSIGMRVSFEEHNNGKKISSPTKKITAVSSNTKKKRRKRYKGSSTRACNIICRIGTNIVEDDDDDDDDDDEDEDEDENDIISTRRTGNIIRLIGNIVGPAVEVSMIDVRTQQLVKDDYTFGQLCDYFDDEKRLMIIGRQHYIQQQQILEQGRQYYIQQLEQNNNNNNNKRRQMPRRKVKTQYDLNGIMEIQILNQVSFEFSSSNLSQYVKSPQFVRELDWIDIVWPSYLRYDTNSGHYPAVQYYCLTSCAGSYMDYHIDFGGSSVWYHIVSGRKEFCLIIPTEENLIQYENWLCNPKQNKLFLLNNIRNKNTIKRIILYQNQTLIIPSGYIHCVYTPIDSIVFGGNFLHGYDIEMQNRIYDIEIRREVLDKYLFP